MAYMRVRSLFVLTLLQLCRAEISDSLPESWYSANVINDGFQPKSLSEIFSTESPFSSTNPIVVLPKQSSSVPEEILLLSTLAPPRKISTTSSSVGDFSKTSVTVLQSSTPQPQTIQTIPQSSLHTLPPTTFQTTPSTFLSTLSTIPDYSPSPVPQQSQSSTSGSQPNYIVIYQQAPQSIQGFPGPVSTTQEVPQLSTIARVPTTREPSTVIIQPAPTVSSPSTRTAPPTSTTPLVTRVRVPTTPSSLTTRNCQNLTNFAPTSIPRLPPSGGSLRIRVVAPTGSITNVNLNPPIRTTTKRPTTTKRATTTKRRKTQRPRKNNYETCTDGCKGKREPICAAPLSTDYLKPDTLKGFPSVCHMACHNSYKKDLYEKVLDGRCGRLRTRIKTVDSDTKLKKEELNKAQYFLDNGPKTVVEFSGLHK